MANFTDDWIAHILAIDYNFLPPVKCHATGGSQIVEGKFEPDHKTFENRCFVLAHWYDHTNVIIQFDPFALEPTTD